MSEVKKLITKWQKQSINADYIDFYDPVTRIITITDFSEVE